MCKGNNSNNNCESAIGKHLITNPESARTCTDDNIWSSGQARSFFHLSVYMKTQNPIFLVKKMSFFNRTLQVNND